MTARILSSESIEKLLSLASPCTIEREASITVVRAAFGCKPVFLKYKVFGKTFYFPFRKQSARK